MKIFRLAAVLPVWWLGCCGCKPPPIDHGVTFLLSVGTNQVSAASSNDLPRVAEVLKKRLDKFGWRSSVECLADNRLSIKLALTAAAEQTDAARKAMTQGGLLEFCLVHEDNTKMLQDGIIPAGYLIMKETHLSPGGQKIVTPLLVNQQRVPGLSGRNIKEATVIRGGMNEPEIVFRFDTAGTAAFAKLTTENLNRQLAIILDGQLYSAPFIKSPITEGNGVITGGFTDEEAFRFAAILDLPLEAAVEILEERSF